MSEIYDKLMTDMKTAMKEHDMVAVNAIRGVIAKAKDLTVNAGKEMTDEAVLSVLSKGAKQREESIAQFTAAGRAELAETEKKGGRQGGDRRDGGIVEEGHGTRHEGDDGPPQGSGRRQARLPTRRCSASVTRNLPIAKDYGVWPHCTRFRVFRGLFFAADLLQLHR